MQPDPTEFSPDPTASGPDPSESCPDPTGSSPDATKSLSSPLQDVVALRLVLTPADDVQYQLLGPMRRPISFAEAEASIASIVGAVPARHVVRIVSTARVVSVVSVVAHRHTNTHAAPSPPSTCAPMHIPCTPHAYPMHMGALHADGDGHGGGAWGHAYRTCMGMCAYAPGLGDQ